MDNFIPDDSGFLKVKTHKSGNFIFQIGLDIEKLNLLKDRVNDAHIRFISMPLLSEISSELEQRVMISSIYSTNTIEGGELTYDETRDVLNLSDNEIKEEREKRVGNLKNAYKFSEEIASSAFLKVLEKFKLSSLPPGHATLEISEKMFQDLHELITKDLKHDLNRPRIYRDNNLAQKTHVGHSDVGGVYRPPKCHADIKMLMEAFCVWANCETLQSLPPLYRAALIHYYFELIHPFWDGNGRTGRLAEATILRTSGYEYAPHAMARYYLDNQLDYFMLLNTCRKNSNNGIENPNSEFVNFFLKGMLTTINRLHDRANSILSDVLIGVRLERSLSKKEISDRQYQLISFLIEKKDIRSKEKLKLQRWHKVLYMGLNERAIARDLKKLSDLNFIQMQTDGTITLNELQPKVKLVDHPHTNIVNNGSNVTPLAQKTTFEN